MTNLVRHSPTALKRYMTDMDISADELGRKTSIKTIHRALQSNEPVFRLSELESIATALFVPSIYLTMDEHIYSANVPNIIDHRNSNNISTNNYKYKSIIRSAANSREDYLYVLDTMSEIPLDFTLKLSGDNPQEDAKRIREYFGLDSTKGRTTKHNDYYSSWRLILEAKDILILEVSEKVGSDGLCLHYDHLPVIVIFSAGQSPERRLFTMIHELVHLGLQQSIFDGKMITDSANHAIERYCDAVTGYVIAPESILEQAYDPNLTIDDLVNKIRLKAKASRPAIAIQLMLTGYISQAELSEYLDHLTFLNSQKKNNDSPPQIPASTRIVSHFGRYFVQAVMSAMWNSQISMSTAKQILGVKETHKPETMQKINKAVFS